MALDLTLEARRAVLSILKADADVLAIVPASSIYPQSPPANPAWPFIRYGSPSGIPRSGSCMIEGEDLIVAVHGFAKPKTTGSGKVTVSAEDRASALGSAIKRALMRRKVPFAGGNISIRWTGSQLMQDGAEADAYHTVQNLRVRALA